MFKNEELSLNFLNLIFELLQIREFNLEAFTKICNF